MLPLDRFYRSLLKFVRRDYVGLWRSIIDFGHSAGKHVFDFFADRFGYMLRWSDLAAASTIRYKAGDLPLQVHADTREMMAHIVAGENSGHVMALEKEYVIQEVISRTPWAKKHVAATNPFVAEKAAMVAEVEAEFARKTVETKKAVDGFVPLYRLEMHRRQAVGEIANTSKQVELADPDISERFPFARYDTREDRRVRATHAAMAGFLAYRGWDGWPTIRPLNGFSCRCGLRMFSLRESIEKGWCDSHGRPAFEVRWPNSLSKLNYEKRLFPDKGWFGPKTWAFPGKPLLGEEAA